MELEDVKALVTSLVVSSSGCCSIQKLLSDFEKETGFLMPVFNFLNAREFLSSLIDTVKIVGKPPNEYVIPVNCEKSSHIAALVKRQGKMHRHSSLAPLLDEGDIFPDQHNLKSATKAVSGCGKMKGLKKSKGSRTILTEDIQENETEEVNKESVFREDDIKNLNEILMNSFASDDSLSKKGIDTDSVATLSSVSLSSVPDCYINDGLIKKLKELMKVQTQGIWCSDLPDVYKEHFGTEFDFRDYGYRSLIEMVKSLKDIFRCVRPNNCDWLLYDASRPPSAEEGEVCSQSFQKLPEDIAMNIRELLDDHYEAGIFAVDFLELYYKKYRVKLDFVKYGFRTLKSLIYNLSGKVLKVEELGDSIFIKPLTVTRVPKQPAVVAITPEDDFFNEFFPADVVRYGEKYLELNIEEHFEVGKITNVNIGDVWSPDKFCIQLKKYETDLNNMMMDLHVFYNINTNKYKMSEPTVRPNQICVVTYKNEGLEEWHRSVIIKVVDKDQVLVCLIDYGMKVKIKKANLRFLHRDFFGLPIQCFIAKLDNIKPAKEDKWPLEACKYFFQLVSVEFISLKVTKLDQQERKITGILLCKEGGHEININTKLVEEEFAVFENMRHLRRDHPHGANDNPVTQRKVNQSKFSLFNDTSADRPSPRMGNGNYTETVKSIHTISAAPDVRRCSGQALSHEKGVSNFHCPDFSRSHSNIVAPNPTVHVGNTYSTRCSDFNIELYERLRTSWTIEKEIEATAFTLINRNDWLKSLIQNDFEKGVFVARTLAEKFVYSGF